MSLPNTFTDINETGCCAVPNIADWDKKEITFDNQKFIRMYTKSFLYVPLNMSKVMTALQKTADDAGATMAPTEAVILSRDISPWKAEQLYGVSKSVDGAENITLDGVFITKVYVGPYKNVSKWLKDLRAYATDVQKKIDRTYFFYTTCPKCAKQYGKNYVIALGHCTN